MLQVWQDIACDALILIAEVFYRILSFRLVRRVEMIHDTRIVKAVERDASADLLCVNICTRALIQIPKAPDRISSFCLVDRVEVVECIFMERAV